MTANVNVTLERIGIGGNDSGIRISSINSEAKAAQSDTWTLLGASTVISVIVTDDTTGALEAITQSNISGNVVTLPSSTTGAKSGIVIYIE